MKLLKPLAGIALLCLPLAGCSSLGTAISAIGTAETAVSFAQKTWSKAGVTLFSVEATYGIIQTATVNFEKAECPTASAHSWCQTLHDQAAKADGVVRQKFADGETFIKSNPTLSPSAAIAAAEGAVNAAAAVADSFGVKL